MTTRDATCSCGQLRLTAEGEPVRVSVCHCLACRAPDGQRVRGPGAVPGAERVRIEGTATASTRAVPTRGGRGLAFSFCPDCGATVFYATELQAGVWSPSRSARSRIRAFPEPTVSVWESRRPCVGRAAARRRAPLRLGRCARGRHAPAGGAAPPGARRRADRGRDPAPARAGRARRRADRRAAARVGRGGRQEPRAPLRGRRRPPLAPADERAAGRSAARRAARRPAVARAPRRAAPRACSGTGRCWSCTRARSRGSGRTSSRGRRDFDAMLARHAPRRPARGARRDAAGPDARRRDREHVDGRDALAGAALAVAAARRRRRRTSAAARSRRRRADARGGRRRAASRAGRCTAAPAGRARAAARRSARAGQGDDEPHRVLVPRLPGRRRAAAPRKAACCVGAAPLRVRSARSVSPRSRPSAARGAVCLRGAREHTAGPSLYEYRPLVRGFVEEQAPTLRRLPDTRNAIDDLRREPAAAIFARAHAGIATTERRRALPHDPPAAADRGPRSAAAASTGTTRRSTSPTPTSSGRSSARRARTSRSRPLVGLSAGDDGRAGRGITLRPAVAGEISQLWPEAHGPDAARVRPRRRPSARARARARARRPTRSSRPTRPASSRTRSPRSGSRPPARSPPGRSSSSGSTFGRCGSRRCLPIAATQPRGEATRLDELRGAARGRPARAAAARRRRPRARRGARPLGAVAVLRGAVSVGAGARGARCAARRGRRQVGRGDARRGAARREDAGAHRAARGAAGRAARPRRARRGAARARRDAPARQPRPSSSARSTRRCSACGRGPRRRPARRRERGRSRNRHGAGTDTSHLRGYGRCMDEAARVLERLERIERARRAAARGRPGECSPSYGRSCRRPRRGRAQRATSARATAARETSRGGGRNGAEPTRNGPHMGLARLLPRPNVRPASEAAPGRLATRRR